MAASIRRQISPAELNSDATKNTFMIGSLERGGPNSAPLPAHRCECGAVKRCSRVMRSRGLRKSCMAWNLRLMEKSVHLGTTAAVGLARARRQGRAWQLVGMRQMSCLLLAVLINMSNPGLPLAQRPIDGDVTAQFGDWQVVCKAPPPGAKSKVCALVQSVTAEDRENVGLTVYVQKFSNGTRVLRVFAPLGVLLPPGLGLKIDGRDVGHAPFLRCHSFACYAQVVVEDDLVKKLSTGKTAIFIIFQT